MTTKRISGKAARGASSRRNPRPLKRAQQGQAGKKTRNSFTRKSTPGDRIGG